MTIRIAKDAETPVVQTSLGAGSTDIAVKAGSTVADVSVNAAAKLFSIRTGIGATEQEIFNFRKNGIIDGTHGSDGITIQHNGANIASFSAGGALAPLVNVTYAIYMNSGSNAGIQWGSSSSGMRLTSEVANSASAMGLLVNTINSWTIYGAKLASFQTANVEKLFIANTGALVGPTIHTNPSSLSFENGNAQLTGYDVNATASTIYLGKSATVGVQAASSIGGTSGDICLKLGTYHTGIVSGAKFASFRAGIDGLEAEWAYIDGVSVYHIGGFTAGASIGTSNAAFYAAGSGYEFRAAGVFKAISELADSAGSIGFITNTSTAYTTSGAKLVSFQNNGVEKLYIDKDGQLWGTLGTSGGLSIPSLRLNQGSAQLIGSNSVGISSLSLINTGSIISTSGSLAGDVCTRVGSSVATASVDPAAKLFQIVTNNSTEVLAFYKDGSIGPTPTLNSYAFSNNWATYGAPYQTAGYRKDALGWVHLQGMIKRSSGTTTAGETMITLPAGFRPANTARFLCDSSSSAQPIEISNTGIIKWPTASVTPTYLALDCISFLAEL